MVVSNVFVTRYEASISLFVNKLVCAFRIILLENISSSRLPGSKGINVH